jgi:hypothetical protein
MIGSRRNPHTRAKPSAAAFLLLLLTIGSQAPALGQSAVKTGKERLGDKASDEQRVDNCKVLPERWGKTARSASCAQGAKGRVTH